MVTRVGLFGFGRIGRNLFRILYNRDDIRVAAVSDLAEPAGIEYLLRFDTMLGRFPDEVSVKEGHIYVVGRQIPVFSGKDQPPVPDWKGLGVDVVFEATNVGRTRAEAERHLEAGARRVILLAPPSEKPDATIVMGVNDGQLRLEHRIVSNASSTVHCVTPVVQILHEAFGIERAIFTTVHSYTSAHRLADVPTEDKRRGRAAAENIIPQESRSPAMVAQLLPALAGRISGYAMNVPVRNGSVVDLVCWHEKKVTPVAINEVLRTAAATARWKSVLRFERDPIVSSDVACSTWSATFDSLATMTLGEKVSKTLSWYDSGFGYAYRAVELVERFAAMEGRS
ncbi:MAG: type I glyceraldehyde-3-phosphate dehydrogenase [Thermoanaerobaculia bacterium]